jgi:hypothetical protein
LAPPTPRAGSLEKTGRADGGPKARGLGRRTVLVPPHVLADAVQKDQHRHRRAGGRPGLVGSVRLPLWAGAALRASVCSLAPVQEAKEPVVAMLA